MKGRMIASALKGEVTKAEEKFTQGAFTLVDLQKAKAFLGVLPRPKCLCCNRGLDFGFELPNGRFIGGECYFNAQRAAGGIPEHWQKTAKGYTRWVDGVDSQPNRLVVYKSTSQGSRNIPGWRGMWAIGNNRQAECVQEFFETRKEAAKYAERMYKKYLTRKGIK